MIRSLLGSCDKSCARIGVNAAWALKNIQVHVIRVVPAIQSDLANGTTRREEADVVEQNIHPTDPAPKKGLFPIMRQ